MRWLLRTRWWVLLTTVTVVAVTRMRTGVAAWVRPMPRWCRRLPWRRVSLPNWSTVSWRGREGLRGVSVANWSGVWWRGGRWAVGGAGAWALGGGGQACSGVVGLGGPLVP